MPGNAICQCHISPHISGRDRLFLQLRSVLEHSEIHHLRRFFEQVYEKGLWDCFFIPKIIMNITFKPVISLTSENTAIFTMICETLANL